MAVSRLGGGLIIALTLSQGGVSQASGLSFADVASPSTLRSCEASPQSFLLPGTDACLRIGGGIRQDFTGRIGSPAFALADPGTRSVAGVRRGGASIDMRAQLSADVRVPTDYGPVRVYVSIRNRRGVAASGPLDRR